MGKREKVYLKDTAIWDSIDHEASEEQFPETYARLDTLLQFSNKYLVWTCAKEEHPSWKAAVYNRTNGNICPYCNSRAVCFSNSVAGTNPVAAAEWCTELNSGVTSDTVSAKSNKRIWWTCYITEHPPWLMSPNQRSRGQGCPYCAGRHAWKRDNLLEKRPDIASYWDINRNTPVTPDQVKPHSDRKVWWTCPAGKHPPHMSAVKDRVRGKGCPQCANKYGRLEKRFGKSFELRGLTPEGYSVRLPDLSYESGKKGVEVDIPLAHDSGNQLLVEIDGERWHKDLGDMDAYKSELLSNLDDNTYHARVRLDNLPFLDFEHERFGQWRYFYDASDDSGIDEVVSYIVEWFNSEIGE